MITALSREDAAHLLRRAGFGGTLAEVESLVGTSPQGAIDALLGWADGDTGGGMDPSVLAQVRDPTSTNRYTPLQRYWYQRMASDPFPLREKLTLFWHGHFTTELRRIADYGLMYDQNQILRAGAKGSFVRLTKDVCLHAAMLNYLDNATSRKGSPNVNFARELQELFTLGVGHYSEPDVYAMAAAWTGYSTDNATNPPTPIFKESWHDTSAGTYQGDTAVWDATGAHGIDIVDRLFDPGRPQRIISARFIARKLFEFLAYEGPDDSVVNELASAFSANDLSVAALVRAIFLHDEFWSARSRQGRLRSPVEWFVAVMRYTVPDVEFAHPEWRNRELGQELFNPPDVSGWKLNRYWLGAGAFWAKGGATVNFRWAVVKAVQAGTLSFLPEIEQDPTMPAAQLAARAFEVFGVLSPSPHSLSVVAQLVNDLRSGDAAYLRHGLIDAVLLSPDFQLA